MMKVLLLLIPVTLLAIIIGKAMRDLLVATFKVSYYEQTLKNNKDVFSKERYGHIQDVMDAKTLKKLKKL